MTDKEVRHLTRAEFLVILRDQEEEIDRLNKEKEKLQQEIDDLKGKLNSKQTNLNEFGSIAEASMNINNVFQSAQEAANQYINEVKAKSKAAGEESARIIAEAKRHAAEILEAAKRGESVDLKTEYNIDAGEPDLDFSSVSEAETTDEEPSESVKADDESPEPSDTDIDIVSDEVKDEEGPSESDDYDDGYEPEDNMNDRMSQEMDEENAEKSDSDDSEGNNSEDDDNLPIDEEYPGMDITSLKENSDIIVSAKSGKKTITFLTKLLDPDDAIYKDMLSRLSSKYGDAPLVPVSVMCTDDNIPLSFMSNGIEFSCVSVVEGRAYKWKNITIPCIKTKGDKLIHVIIAPDQGAVTNRRDDYRMFVGADGVLSIPYIDKEITAIIKDVSVSGIGIVVPRYPEINMGETVRAKFTATVKRLPGKKVGGNLNFDIMGRIIRKMDIDDDKVLYGIQLLAHYNTLTRYINIRQSEKIENERSFKELGNGLGGALGAPHAT
jgi:phage shock protein A